MRDAADISAFGAGNTKPAEWFVIISKTEVVNVYQARFPFDFNAFARQFVQRHALLLYGRNHRRHLHLVAHERRGGFVQLVERQ